MRQPPVLAVWLIRARDERARIASASARAALTAAGNPCRERLITPVPWCGTDSRGGADDRSGQHRRASRRSEGISCRGSDDLYRGSRVVSRGSEQLNVLPGRHAAEPMAQRIGALLGRGQPEHCGSPRTLACPRSPRSQQSLDERGVAAGQDGRPAPAQSSRPRAPGSPSARRRTGRSPSRRAPAAPA